MIKVNFMVIRRSTQQSRKARTFHEDTTRPMNKSVAIWGKALTPEQTELLKARKDTQEESFFGKSGTHMRTSRKDA